MGWDEVRILILRRPQILQNLHLTFVYSTYSKVKVKSSWTTKSFLACSQKVYRITDTYVSLLSLDFVRSHFRKMHTLVGFSIGKKQMIVHLIKILTREWIWIVRFMVDFMHTFVKPLSMQHPMGPVKMEISPKIN